MSLDKVFASLTYLTPVCGSEHKHAVHRGKGIVEQAATPLVRAMFLGCFHNIYICLVQGSPPAV